MGVYIKGCFVDYIGHDPHMLSLLCLDCPQDSSDPSS